jgi:hypothetical protein
MMEQFFLNLKCPGGYFAVEENSWLKYFRKTVELQSEITVAWKLLPRVPLLPFNLSPQVPLRLVSLKNINLFLHCTISVLTRRVPTSYYFHLVRETVYILGSDSSILFAFFEMTVEQIYLAGLIFGDFVRTYWPFKNEAYLFYIRTQCVPCCKHSPLRL